MKNPLNASIDALHGSKETLKNDLAGAVDDAAELLRNFSARKLEGAKQYADLTNDYVRANPWAALGVAAAAGLLVGIVLARR
jgi:ElaB/YqjD/DUF883 family membrane-anchored ribosome-binding protein